MLGNGTLTHLLDKQADNSHTTKKSKVPKTDSCETTQSNFNRILCNFDRFVIETSYHFYCKNRPTFKNVVNQRLQFCINIGVAI